MKRFITLGDLTRHKSHETERSKALNHAVQVFTSYRNKQVLLAMGAFVELGGELTMIGAAIGGGNILALAGKELATRVGTRVAGTALRAAHTYSPEFLRKLIKRNNSTPDMVSKQIDTLQRLDPDKASILAPLREQASVGTYVRQRILEDLAPYAQEIPFLSNAIAFLKKHALGNHAEDKLLAALAEFNRGSKCLEAVSQMRIIKVKVTPN